MEAKRHQSHKDVRDSLRGAGIQPSASRTAIAHFVCNTNTHPTAEEVKDEVEKSFPTVSLATVYNTLNLLVEKGLLKELSEPGRRSIRYDCNTLPHFHFIDDETGRIIDLDSDVLKIGPDLSRLSEQYKIREIEVTLRGQKIMRPSDESKNHQSKKGVPR